MAVLLTCGTPERVLQLEFSAPTTGATGSTVRIEALGASPIHISSFDFVRLQEGVHGGYFDIDGMPWAGGPATAQARLWRGPDEATCWRSPRGAKPLGYINVRMTATDVTDASLRNNVSAMLEVARAGDADNDDVPDASDNCRDVPNHDQRDRNGNDIGEACDPADRAECRSVQRASRSGVGGECDRTDGYRAG